MVLLALSLSLPRMISLPIRSAGMIHLFPQHLTPILLTVAVILPSFVAHPDRVPESACVTMAPDHGRARPQTLSQAWRVYDIDIFPGLVYERGEPITGWCEI